MPRNRAVLDHCRANGICTRCTKAPADEGFKTCAPCREYARIKGHQRTPEQRRRVWAKWFSKPKNRNYNAKRGKKYHAAHRDRLSKVKKEKRRAWAEAGLCTDCGKRQPGHPYRMCQPCRERKHVGAVANRIEKKPAEELTLRERAGIVYTPPPIAHHLAMLGIKPKRDAR